MFLSTGEFWKRPDPNRHEEEAGRTHSCGQSVDSSHVRELERHKRTHTAFSETGICTSHAHAHTHTHTHIVSLIVNQSRIQTTCFSANPEPDRIISHLTDFILVNYNVHLERKDGVTNSFSTRIVSHTLCCVHEGCVGVCVPLCVGSASPQWVCFSPASAGSVWPAAHTPAGRCSDSDGPTAAVCKTHTHTILTETVWEERTLLADIKPNVVNIERELDPQRAFNITGLCVDQVINTVYRDVTAVFVL